MTDLTLTDISGANAALVGRLMVRADALRERITGHRLYELMGEGRLSRPAIHGFLASLAHWFRGTLDRTIRRAQSTPYGPVKRNWLLWACEEFGHAEMLFDVVRSIGGDAGAWEKRRLIYEAEALVSYAWRLADQGTYLENAASAFLAGEGTLRLSCRRSGRTCATSTRLRLKP
jgi:hypothetical protein